ncbi:MAG: 16S rRNA (guanine(966)-N(2))-methyltransferase RsmD [Candidatus Neomarinimicrobiota bacterium]
MMKINSGLFRNTSIEILKNSSFRPTTSISRKSFFDTIGSLEGKLFLDLFAGSGIVGFEAASRGAKNVTFVEMNKRYLNQIITNSKKFEYDQFNFMARDALRFIKKSESYDIIFADPPYRLYEMNVFVKNALKKLNKGGTLIVESSSKETLEGFDKIAKFGDTNLLYWKV